MLAAAFRSHGRLVVLVRATILADGSDWPQGRTDRPRRRPHRPAGWDVIAEDLAGHPEDVLVTNATQARSTAPTWTCSCVAAGSPRSC